MRELMRPAGIAARYVLVAFLCATATSDLRGQSASGLDLGGPVAVGGEAERYLRVLQLTGSIGSTGWSVQPFGAAVARALAPVGAHPWASRFTPADSAPHLSWIRPAATVIANSAFPFQEAVGPTWAGRGVTTSLQGGFRAQWGRLTAQVAPVAFISQNSEFPLAANGLTGDAKFRDVRYPNNIDFPQRFGDKAYGRLDAGSSFVALDLPGLMVGATNEPQRWGPAREYPLVVGPAAGGFPHAFAGTRAPVDIGIGTIQARYIAGSLTQSAFSAATAGETDRFASAAIVSVSPRGTGGLELGFLRFFETTNPASVKGLLRPLSIAAFIGAQGDTSAANIPRENQIASAFFRWPFAAAGVEVYGEWYREDFPGDLRKFILKPDDLSNFEIGIQRVWSATATIRRVFRFEIVNAELSHQERGQRGLAYPESPYIHFEVLQGHTQHGLVLGSPEAFGGAAWRIGVDEYTPRGRSSISVERVLHFDQSPVVPAGSRPDVLYGVRAEVLRFAGARDYTLALEPAINLNRNLFPHNDVFNLHAVLSVHGW